MIWSKCRPLALVLLALGLPASAAARPAEVLEPVMAGEFALQAGDLAQSAGHYLRAAQGSRDPGLAERATRIALLADRPDLASQAIQRWQALAPDAASLPEAALALALARGDQEAATDSIVKLLGRPDDAGLPALVSALGAVPPAQRAVAREALGRVRAAEILPARFGPWLTMASLARRLDAPELAEALVVEGLARFPDDPRARLLQADRTRREGLDEAARGHLRALGDPSALEPELRRAAARQWALLGDRLLAARVLGAGPQDDDTLRQRARWLLDAGDRAALAALYQEAVALSRSPPSERRVLLGMLAEGLLRWREAEAWYASVPPGPGHDQARLRRAGALGRLGRIDQALDTLRSLRGDEEADGEAIRDAFLLEAELLERRGRVDEARTVLDESLAVFEDDPPLRYARAMLNERSGRVDAALAELRELAVQQPGSHQALNAYGYALLVHRGQAAEALPYLERALALAPDSAAVLDSVGWAHFRLGDGEKALALLRQAWSRQRMPEVAAHLGEVLWSLGQREEAREVWRAGLRLSSSDPTLNDTLDRLLENRSP